MKLPPVAPPAMHFINAKGSNVPQEFAIAARANPDVIPQMAETPKELQALQKEALARQYVIIVDMSGSMAARDGKGTRWDSARSAVEKMVDTIFAYDVDHTVPLYLFDSEVTFIGELTKASQVKAVFKEFGPRGTTGLGAALREALSTYAGTKRPNYQLVPGTTFIVLLDGGADDEADVMRVLQEFADPRNGYIENHTQIALSFVQVGDDASASAFLQKLDDSITPDICDFKRDDILTQLGGLDRLLHDAIFD
ncbi:hypothetical protein JKP88DRAFT_163605 [Tribonema minus]|uniref:VWFA domain-containing protein n=1 Tax=Tribonema minus TaxID=303371 RepID=A0A836CG78_9STRA|nr:hypothetical protein JKP88DRAFT_163605 [Tribonema minus]